MLKLIVNADDFGLSDIINEGILESYLKGILRSTSLVANGKAFDHSLEIIRSHPELDVGVHLTLVEEKPILDENKVPSLIFKNGHFYNHANDFTKRYLSKKISFNEVKNELNAQIEKILDNRIVISHMDSHQHLHLLPRILDITIELANRYKIKFIRLPKEKFRSYMFHDLNEITRIEQMAVVNSLCSKAKKKISNRTDHFVGFYYGGKLRRQNLLKLIENLPNDGICELMCHPGLSNYSTDYSHWNYRQIEEMHALIDVEVSELIVKKNIQIASFKNLV